jgi:hypothetical protein
MIKKKYSVPYQVNYHQYPLFWEVVACDKKEAREKAVQDLSSDSDVFHIASTRHIIEMGEVKK